MGRTVIILDDPPNFSFDPPKCAYRRPLGENRCVDEPGYYLKQRRLFYPELQAIAAKAPGTRVIDAVQYFCDGDLCRMDRDGKVFYRDRNHINIEATHYFAQRLSADYPSLFGEAPGARTQ
jgi:hypothetical protein